MANDIRNEVYASFGESPYWIETIGTTPSTFVLGGIVGSGPTFIQNSGVLVSLKAVGRRPSGTTAGAFWIAGVFKLGAAGTSMTQVGTTQNVVAAQLDSDLSGSTVTLAGITDGISVTITSTSANNYHWHVYAEIQIIEDVA
jgi:hypothetical protein